MRKFQQWQDTQVYFTHINSLASIKTRRPLNYRENKNKTKSKIENRSIDKENSIDNKIFIRSVRTSFKPKRIKDKGVLDQKKLDFQNLLLGRRLMRTPHSFGNTFRQNSIQNKSNSTQNLNALSQRFWKERSSKLRDFQSLLPEFRYVKGKGRYLLKLVIVNLQLQLLKSKLSQLVNVSLIVQCGKYKKSSQLIAINNLLGHQFILRFAKHLHGKHIKVLIRYHKGNSDLQLGQFQLKIPKKQSEIQQITTNLNRKSGITTGLVTFKGKIYKAFNDYDKL